MLEIVYYGCSKITTVSCYCSNEFDLFTKQLRFSLRQNLIEDVVIPFSLKLEGDTGLFQQICKNISIMQIGK